MKKSELKAIIQEIEKEENLEWSEEGRDICEYGYAEDSPFYIALKKKGLTFKNVDQSGGEGEGDRYSYVFSVTEEDGTTTFFQCTGWYASYVGSEVDPWDFHRVEKVPVQVYQWKEV